jgi:hypothetical protein
MAFHNRAALGSRNVAVTLRVTKHEPRKGFAAYGPVTGVLHPSQPLLHHAERDGYYQAES